MSIFRRDKTFTQPINWITTSFMATFHVAAIPNFIVRLRRYIEREPSKPLHLLIIRGVGYQFVPNPKR